MFRINTSLVAATVSLIAAFAQFEAAQAQTTQRILPKRLAIEGNDSFLVLPLRCYFEYGHGTAVSRNHPASTVDLKRNSYTIGTDFITSWVGFVGVNLQFTDIHDRGTQQPFVFSLDTQKDLVGGQFYYSQYILPNLLAGFSFEYHQADGRSIYNNAVVNNERSEYLTFTPFLGYSRALSPRWRLNTGIAFSFMRGDFDYDLNVPPRAVTRSTSMSLPIGLEYRLLRNLAVSGSAQWNQILSIETFNNMPEPDRSTMTLTLGARYFLPNGASLYGNVSHDVFDDAYKSTRVLVGVSIAPWTLANPAVLPASRTPHVR